MANFLYDAIRKKMLEGDFNWKLNTIKAVLIDTSQYTPNQAFHEYLSDVPISARVATSSAFTNKSTVGGAADADDLVFQSVSGPTIKAIIIYRDFGADNKSDLIAYIDSSAGLPIAPNGNDIIIVWDNGPNKIFKP